MFEKYAEANFCIDGLKKINEEYMNKWMYKLMTLWFHYGYYLLNNFCMIDITVMQMSVTHHFNYICYLDLKD